MTYPIHPAVEATPSLTADEYAEMVQSIRERGQLDPITVCQGYIVDGRHRFRACQELGIVPRFVIRDDIPDIALFVWDRCGIGRQFTSQEQRYMVWKRLHGMSEEHQAKLAAVKAEQRAKQAEAKVGNDNAAKGKTIPAQPVQALNHAPKPTGDKSRAIAAEAAKVNRGAVQRAEALERKAPELAAKVASGELPFTAAAKKANVHVSNNSGENEWYTPPEYIAAARRCMGGIDIDPASCAKAQETVQAAVFYDAEANGLDKEWKGRVWMNPPYAAELIKRFAARTAQSVIAGDVEQACILVNNATEASWFQVLVGVASAVGFTKKRVRFLDQNGKPGAPLQGQAVIYIGTNVAGFCEAFADMCWCAEVRR